MNTQEVRQVKTTLYIQEDLFLKGKILSIKHKKTFTDLLNEALKEYLERHKEELKGIIDG
ncbi:hypothetical protein [Sulfolobus spindle-shaped virus]|nr:hypothetical protein [Sulfolobus spindle-shaped virus]QGA87294.1 hypothetical protein [Sulfolobus spindle-shaped virus]